MACPFNHCHFHASRRNAAVEFLNKTQMLKKKSSEAHRQQQPDYSPILECFHRGSLLLLVTEWRTRHGDETELDCFMAKTTENPPLSDGRVRGGDYSSVTLRWAIATKQICQALFLSEVSDGELTLKTRGSSPTPMTLNWMRVRK